MKPPAWSFSALNAFLTCPRQYEAVKVSKRFEETKSDATLWGTYFHEVAERYLKDEAPLPEEFEQYRAYLDKYKNTFGKLAVELKLGITRTLEPCDFHAPNVWCRGIVDVLAQIDNIAIVVDHKTGKRKPDSKQLKLFALLVFAHFPKTKMCLTKFEWIKSGESDISTFMRAEIPALWGDFVPELKLFAEAFKTETFTPKQSGLCKAHCPVSDCEFHGTGRR